MNNFEQKVLVWVHRLTLLAVAALLIVVAWMEAVNVIIKFATP